MSSPKYVNFIEAIQLFFKNYLNQKGRSTRSEYWFFILFNFIVTSACSILGYRTEWLICKTTDLYGNVSGYSVFTVIWLVIIFIPSICLSIRRMHDIGKSGAWILIEFVPAVGTLLFVILACIPSDGDNKYGLAAYPKN